ncbi:uroporphyrinogen decarboxylase family protein [Acidobacteriota bacterium]
MKETMTRYERVHTAWNLKEGDRVPASPLHCYIIPYLGGITIREMFLEPEKLIQAYIKCMDLIGDSIDPNITTLDHLSFLGKSGWDQVTLDWRIWDDFPPKGNIPSFFEKSIIEDYDDVMERGFATLLFNRQLDNEIFDRSIDDFLNYEFDYPKAYAEAWSKYVEEYGIPLEMGGRSTIPFELILYYRGFDQYVNDIFEIPDKVKAMCEWVLEHEILNGMKQAMIMGAGDVPGAEIVFFQAGVVGPPYVSPEVFEQFVWPTLKKGVDMIVNRGFKAHVHMDGDLTPVLPILKDIGKGLPKGKILLDFEKTDMKKAKEILGDRVCLFGNIPAALLCFGSTTEVEEYCKKLITDCAEGGGFIMSTECETPWNAKPENVKTILETAKKYGQY